MDTQLGACIARRLFRKGNFTTMACPLLALLLGTVVAGCATYWHAHTAGTSGPIAWHVTEAKSESTLAEDRYVYSFVLVLQETQGTPITFTTMTYTVYSGTETHSPSYGETVDRNIQLRPRSAYRLPFTFTITCPELRACSKIVGLAPTYHIMLTGTDNHAKPVHVSIDIKLPPDPKAIQQR